MSRLRVFLQTGWFIAGLMAGLPASAAPAETSSMAGGAGAAGHKTASPGNSHVTVHAVLSAGACGAGAA